MLYSQGGFLLRAFRLLGLRETIGVRESAEVDSEVIFPRAHSVSKAFEMCAVLLRFSLVCPLLECLANTATITTEVMR